MIMTPIKAEAPVTGVTLILDSKDAADLSKILGAYYHAHSGSTDATIANRAFNAQDWREMLTSVLDD